MLLSMFWLFLLIICAFERLFSASTSSYQFMKKHFNIFLFRHFIKVAHTVSRLKKLDIVYFLVCDIVLFFETSTATSSMIFKNRKLIYSKSPKQSHTKCAVIRKWIILNENDWNLLTMLIECDIFTSETVKNIQKQTQEVNDNADWGKTFNNLKFS